MVRKECASETHWNNLTYSDRKKEDLNSALYYLFSCIMKTNFTYKLLALVSLAITDIATDSKFYQERRKECQITDFGAERAL